MGIWGNILASSIVFLAFITIAIFVYYVFAYRNIKARRKHFEELHKNLAVGQRVEFANGLQGVVRYVTDETCDIEIKSGGIVTVSRYAISHLIH
ncbi:MAG: preprotein translocase subunit YajC [Aerococcaceae bacterium]|nr:preprotein translocase subunit YajC [Aerococcaceae bacterium]